MPSPLKTGEFLRAILPSTGVYFAAHPAPRGQRGFVHLPFDDISQMSAEIQALSAQGRDLYHACASYHTARYQDPKTGTWHSRKAENVKAYRAVWTDIDVGKPGAYATRNDAVTALMGLCQQDAHIPTPTILVVSGYGIHAYWHFDRDLDPDQWRTIAGTLQALEQHYRLLADHTVTTDAARVLRPVGTFNYKKRETPMPVSGRLLGAPLDPDAFLTLLTARCDALDLEPKVAQPRQVHSLGGDLDDLVAGIDTDYPPSDAERIADQCLVFGDMRATRGANQDQPLWFASLLVLAKTVQVDDVVHAWSDGHEDYDPSAVDSLLERIRANDRSKPARCDLFRTNTTLCANCTLKVNSPIVLGFPERGNQSVVKAPDGVDQDGETHETIDPDPAVVLDLIFGEDRYRWNNAGGLQVRIDPKPVKAKTKADADSTDAEAEPAEETAKPVWVTCSNQYPVVDFLWYDHQVDEYFARIRARIKYKTWSETDIRLAMVGQGGSALMRDLAGKARILSVGPTSAPLETYMKTWIDHVQRETDTQHVRNSLGWQPDDGFLLGKTYYPPDGVPMPVAVGRQIANYITAHNPRGKLDRAVELVDQLYNRPGYEAHQFALLASLGSVLLHLVWNGPVGIPIVLWSEATGIGKSTLAKVGIALWGDPHAHGQTANARGTTELALYTMAGQRKHMPVLLDEATPWEGTRLSDFVYRYSDGTPKQQAKAEGGLRDNSHISWCNMIYVTSNKSVINMIAAAHRNAAPQIARVFEIELPTVKLSVADQAMLDELFQHTGTIGAAFVKAIARYTTRAKVVQLLKQKIQELYGRTGTNTEARYWVYAAAATLVAGHVARSLGLIKFDIPAIDVWSRNQICHLAGRAEYAHEDAEDTLSDMLRDLYPGILITLTEGRANQGAVLAPNTYLPRGTLAGRVITEQSVLYLATGAVQGWCSDNGIDMRLLAASLQKKGCLTKASERYHLGRGTNLPGTTRVRCWQLQGDLVSATLDNLPSNVIQGNFRGQDQDPVDPSVPADEVRADAERP